MIAAAIEKILGLAKIRTQEIHGETFSKEALRRIQKPEQVAPETEVFHNLDGLLEYVDIISTVHLDSTSLPVEGFDREKLFFAVKSPTEVSLTTSPDPKNENQQFKFAKAILNVEHFGFGDWYDLEAFIINMMSLFEQTKERDALIGMMANIANEHIVQNADDKFTQTLQVSTGLTTKANETIENPITLKPFRTFREIEQPDSDFILRYQNRSGIKAALFEGDGGCWKLDAILRIKEWLSDKTEIPVIG